jgi:hypothetical protein
MDRDPEVVWERKGGKSMEDRVLQRLHSILETHQPEPLSTYSQGQIAAILAEITVT